MAIRYRVLAVESSGGEIVQLPTRGVTAIVGGNNAGKSQMLRDIMARVKTGQPGVAVVTLADMSAERPSGTATEVESWLEGHAYRANQSLERVGRYAASPGQSGHTVAEIMGWFPHQYGGPDDPYLGNIPDFFVRQTSAGGLSDYAAGAVEANGYAKINSPLARLLRDGELEDELSRLVEETFGHGLLLDRISPEIRLRVGTVTEPVPPLNRPTAAYAEAVAKLPTLDAQGDGFRSFVGLALLIMADRPNVLLIDEPEAFLHPGQARALGRWLAKRAVSHDHQIIVATHDRDVVLGLIEGASTSSVTFVRLNRDGDTTHMTQLSPTDVEKVWDQPALRYSNVVQGLFHKRVVMCEGDGDCRFYGAALDELAIASGQRSIADDVLFVPSGGKSGVPRMAAALTSLGVEARAILDFDVLRVKADTRQTVESLGATWTPTLDSLYTSFVRVPNERGLWPALKNVGLAGVPSGSSYTAAESLLRELGKVGLYIVPVGEMEDFNKTLGVHGPAWVSAALAANTHGSAQVHDLVTPILSAV
ncbi:ABC-type enterochelin transport system ATPase subunit [Agromyces cerinus]|uniref:ATP-dependent nuclease n=1 Tax=Agromyces cerinus TaxID=33878 RepID=UPI00195A404E|nr:ATP-binding protein [Agromyces cerinus]MBM7831642.1 ABC-type enterochelin transport system ATPase subunit [Agromyces cerinus]